MVVKLSNILKPFSNRLQFKLNRSDNSVSSSTSASSIEHGKITLTSNFSTPPAHTSAPLPRYESAKQRATVKWLLSKAYNNKVPDNIREPFYKDHENQEHLKPQLVHSFANAELYCLALANIYTDPNYHNLNHWGILRALNNKGIFPDKRLTETVLIQTNPLKL
ncbi:patronin-like, partial [Diaphorina citri]|uniref:Patronin-like n=1 Tax=Diaphorina citri TaxID=121845 RepID=A0A3Q0J3D8_DIACI